MARNIEICKDGTKVTSTHNKMVVLVHMVVSVQKKEK
jgi:hypothetical protein